MAVDPVRPNWRERLAAGALSFLNRAGLGRLAHSGVVRAVGKRLLLRRASGPALREIVSGPARGLRLCVLPGTPQSYWMGTHEAEVQAVFAERVRPGMVVYDCGANVGYFSLYLARLVGPAGRVYAFEPSADSAAAVRAAAEANGFANLTVVAEAVWSHGETLRFARGEKEALASDHVAGAFPESVDRWCVEVPAVSLDEFVYGRGHPPPDFVKIDVEGSEGQAMAGAMRVLRERRPPLLLEIHGGPGREVWQRLGELGYTARNIHTGAVPKTADEFAVWITQYLALPGGP